MMTSITFYTNKRGRPLMNWVQTEKKIQPGEYCMHAISNLKENEGNKLFELFIRQTFFLATNLVKNALCDFPRLVSCGKSRLRQ